MYNIYIGFCFLKYILRFRSTRSRRPRRSRQGRNPRFGGSGNCLGKCFRKCLGSCLGSWGTMDFSISLTLFWSGNREDFALYWHTSCPQMHLAANLSNNIQHIFPFPPQKETIWDCCDGGRFSRQLSLCCVQAPKKSSQSFRSEPYPKVIQAAAFCASLIPYTLHRIWSLKERPKDQMGTWWFETFCWELVVVFYKIHLAGEVTKAVHPTSAAGQSCILKGRGNAKPMESALTSCMTSLQNARRMFWRVFTKWAIVPTFGIATASKVSQSNVLLCCALWRPTCCVASVGKKKSGTFCCCQLKKRQRPKWVGMDIARFSQNWLSYRYLRSWWI